MTGAFTQDSDALGASVLSVALIGPEERRRQEMAEALRGPQVTAVYEFRSYPSLDEVPRLVEAEYDVIIVELDSNPEHALDLIEHICGHSSATVMVYSAQADRDLLVRSMRAGAREFLAQPVTSGAVAEALVRASVRRPAARSGKKAGGKLLVFAGAKGGSGVTTIASNFAIALAQESGRGTVLIDLGLPLGDAAVDLGITAQFSTASALDNIDRLDSNFLSTLLSKHSSGLSVLAAPDRYTPIRPADEAVAKLLGVAKQDFEFVVVDAGSGIALGYRELFEAATSVYLVTQVSISELRNCNRLISQFFRPGSAELQVILNRYMPRSLEIDEESITKALTVPARWKVPSDYPAVRLAQNTAAPLALQNSPVSRVIRQMARVACGLPATPQKKWLSLFG